MSFVLHALLTPGAPATSLEDLKRTLDERFGRRRSFSCLFEQVPLIQRRSLRAQWDDWSIVFYRDEGHGVTQDCQEIRRRLAAASPPGLEAIDRRVYAMFPDDPGRG